MKRYNFVPKLEKITNQELAILRERPKGSHTDLMLKESLLDCQYDQNKMRQILSTKQDLWMINSFMDLNPYLKNHCEGTSLRSEFLFLRYLGDAVFDNLKKEEYIRFSEEKVFDSLPQKVIYRLCDYNNNDFNFLRENFQSRGAARLLKQNSLLETDLGAIKALRKNGNDVDVLVPYVVFHEEFSELKQRIIEKIGNIKIGTMLEVPANLLEIEKYIKADFFVPGPGDLTKSVYGGIDRNSPDSNRVNPNLAFPMVRSALKELDNLGQPKTVYLVKNLIDVDLGRYENLKLVDMYMPSQLMAEAKK